MYPNADPDIDHEIKVKSESKKNARQKKLALSWYEGLDVPLLRIWHLTLAVTLDRE